MIKSHRYENELYCLFKNKRLEIDLNIKLDESALGIIEHTLIS